MLCSAGVSSRDAFAWRISTKRAVRSGRWELRRAPRDRTIRLCGLGECPEFLDGQSLDLRLEIECDRGDGEPRTDLRDVDRRGDLEPFRRVACLRQNEG